MPSTKISNFLCHNYHRCSLNIALQQQPHILNVPAPRKLYDESNMEIPYLIVADDAFALRPNLMKPFPHKTTDVDEMVFNYRLSRARRIVENAFGISAMRFRVFRKTMELQPHRCQLVTETVCVLHNFLVTRNAAAYFANALDQERDDGEFIPGAWRLEPSEIIPLEYDHTAGRPLATAKDIRNHLKEYFMSAEGSVDWQFNSVFRG